MQVRPFSVFSPMFDDQNGKVIVLQSGPCRLLKILDDFLDLLVGWFVLGRKCDHG
jgi:hypothetical protein